MSTIAQTKTVEKDVKNLANLKKVETPKSTEQIEKTPKSEVSQSVQTNEVLNLLNPSAENRLKKLEQFQVLAEKFKLLKGMDDNLTKFILSADGSKELIELSNSGGFKFQVSNTQTIEKVLDLIQNELKVFIDKAEAEVKAFII